MKDLDKYRGCLVGGAAGDALGYPVEFLTEQAILARYGQEGITGYELKNGTAEISDDTQMTLFTATGLLLATTRRMTRGISGTYTDYIRLTYTDWYRTQSQRYPLPGNSHCSWLVNQPELFACRAPGITCLSALSGSGQGTIEHPINQSKGCGGIMRVAPHRPVPGPGRAAHRSDRPNWRRGRRPDPRALAGVYPGGRAGAHGASSCPL